MGSFSLDLLWFALIVGSIAGLFLLEYLLEKIGIRVNLSEAIKTVAHFFFPFFKE